MESLAIGIWRQHLGDSKRIVLHSHSELDSGNEKVVDL